jgi:hypothetical protein
MTFCCCRCLNNMLSSRAIQRRLISLAFFLSFFLSSFFSFFLSFFSPFFLPSSASLSYCSYVCSLSTYVLCFEFNLFVFCEWVSFHAMRWWASLHEKLFIFRFSPMTSLQCDVRTPGANPIELFLSEKRENFTQILICDFM